MSARRAEAALADARSGKPPPRYAAQMILAMQEWQDGNVARVLAL
jgi:hypothetical protein